MLNVLLGQMSLVGPRPPLPYEARVVQTPDGSVLSVTPGLTGLWQVSGRSRLTFDEMVELDLTYIEQWSLWLDLQIMLRTPLAVLAATGLAGAGVHQPRPDSARFRRARAGRAQQPAARDTVAPRLCCASTTRTTALTCWTRPTSHAAGQWRQYRSPRGRRPRTADRSGGPSSANRAGRARVGALPPRQHVQVVHRGVFEDARKLVGRRITVKPASETGAGFETEQAGQAWRVDVGINQYDPIASASPRPWPDRRDGRRTFGRPRAHDGDLTFHAGHRAGHGRIASRGASSASGASDGRDASRRR